MFEFVVQFLASLNKHTYPRRASRACLIGNAGTLVVWYIEGAPRRGAS